MERFLIPICLRSLCRHTKRNYKLARVSKHGLPGTIQVLIDGSEIMEAIRQFQANTRTFWGACVDSSLPEFSVGKVKQGYIDAKKRGVRILYITEITKGNLRHCMEIMQLAELRHLDGVRGNFAVSDTEYVAGVKRGSALVSLVHSDIAELVMQQRHVFDTLWQQAAPAKERLERL
nr:hypothetical protein Josef01_02j05_59 [uncultured archaeon]